MYHLGKHVLPINVNICEALMLDHYDLHGPLRGSIDDVNRQWTFSNGSNNRFS